MPVEHQDFELLQSGQRMFSEIVDARHGREDCSPSPVACGPMSVLVSPSRAHVVVAAASHAHLKLVKA
jgi:hypothetical protein